MFTLVKILILLWLLFCVCLGLGAIAITSWNPDQLDEILTVEELMRQDPEMTREEAEQAVAAFEKGFEATLGCCGAIGSGWVFVIWAVGMIPLVIFYLVAKPRRATVEVEQRRLE